VASVIGIGGMAGAMGGMLMTTYNGYILEVFKSYQPIFIVAGSMYLVAILVIHFLTPRLTPVAVERIKANG
jgi:ACS family hexuronate transporter-like MFS transporter